jgi:hypothetical protein
MDERKIKLIGTSKQTDCLIYLQEHLCNRFTIDNIANKVIECFVGTKQTRVGPAPSKESLQLMNKVVVNCIQSNIPIPLLIAISACKLPLSANVSFDLAEYFFLETIMKLDNDIRKYYSPGLDIRIRIEDITVLYLFDSTNKVREIIESYVSSLKNLCYMICKSNRITLICESQMVSEEKWMEQSNLVLPLMYNYICKTNNSSPGHDWCYEYSKLIELGWKGDVSQEMRNFIRTQYSVMYPSLIDKDTMMSKYLTCILVRRILNAVGNHSSWDKTGRLELTFTTPLPDCPKVNTRIHYRCLPLSDSKLSLPFWRAKGLIKKDFKIPSYSFAMTRIDDTHWVSNGVYIEFTDNSNSEYVTTFPYYQYDNGKSTL